MKHYKYFFICILFLIACCLDVCAEEILFKVSYSDKEIKNVYNEYSCFSNVERIGFHDADKRLKLPSFIKIPEVVENVIKIARRPALITIGEVNTSLKRNIIPNEFEFNKKSNQKVRGRRGLNINILSISF
jgi:hypothetical protein